MNLEFEHWWAEEGSMRPRKGLDVAEHTKKMCEIAWENGSYKSRSTVLKDAIEHILGHFGRENQMKMVIGEIGELLTLWGREIQGRATNEDWLNELADTHIMLIQLRMMLGIDEDTLGVKVNERVNRTLQRIKDGYYK